MDKHHVNERIMTMLESVQTLFGWGIINATEMLEFDKHCLAQEDKIPLIASVTRIKLITPVFTTLRY